jgi:hypothetical protein
MARGSLKTLIIGIQAPPWMEARVPLERSSTLTATRPCPSGVTAALASLA